MNTNRPYYVYKFNSGRLREFKYNIEISFDEARARGEIIALAGSQMIRSIYDITGKYYDAEQLEEWISEKEFLRKKDKKTPAEITRLAKVQKDIYNMMFVPEYLTIVMEHPSHYEYIFKNGVKINGHTYKRISCSAGQARVSTVVLCDTEIIDELRKRLNNGRDVEVPLAPSKFNAYFGLASSATKTVSEPRFVVVKDYINYTDFMANFVTETDWNTDDRIEQKIIEHMEMKRTDGMGLISPELSKKWADELGLDYIPAQWCVRQSFIKGMVCTFPIHEFCEEVNGGNYLIKTIYKDENGNPIYADLRDYDMIISESQFKLWKSYPSVDKYIEECHKNKLEWGVSQYTPKVAKDILNLNYQFIQTLDLNENDVRELADEFVRYINGVSYDNYFYMLLFLLGENVSAYKIKDYVQQSDNHWLRALILNPELRNDKYIRTKIRDLIKTKIQNGCMGEIMVDGNFQVIVSDPYAYMQHVCGLEVTGLLKESEFYSNYWNEKNVDTVDTMRSPLTYRSEHVVTHLVKNEETEKWYRYCYLGFIVNWHGHECVRWAGSDFDYDIIASTSNKTMIKGTYKNELPVVYDPPSPKAINFTEEDLYKADTFGFGSIIGSITNKSSIAYAMLPNIERDYGKDSEEYKLTVSRLQQCCKAQSAQIDS